MKANFEGLYFMQDLVERPEPHPIVPSRRGWGWGGGGGSVKGAVSRF